MELEITRKGSYSREVVQEQLISALRAQVCTNFVDPIPELTKQFDRGCHLKNGLEDLVDLQPCSEYDDALDVIDTDLAYFDIA